jgi:hypothetical protein
MYTGLLCLCTCLNSSQDHALALFTAQTVGSVYAHTPHAKQVLRLRCYKSCNANLVVIYLIDIRQVVLADDRHLHHRSFYKVGRAANNGPQQVISLSHVCMQAEGWLQNAGIALQCIRFGNPNSSNDSSGRVDDEYIERFRCLEPIRQLLRVIAVPLFTFHSRRD